MEGRSRKMEADAHPESVAIYMTCSMLQAPHALPRSGNSAELLPHCVYCRL